MAQAKSELGPAKSYLLIRVEYQSYAKAELDIKTMTLNKMTGSQPPSLAVGLWGQVGNEEGQYRDLAGRR